MQASLVRSACVEMASLEAAAFDSSEKLLLTPRRNDHLAKKDAMLRECHGPEV